MRNLPLALLDHCPDVVGKSTYGKVNLVCRRDVIGMLLRWAAPSYVLQLKSPKRMTASLRQRGLLGRAGATVLETGDRPRL
ncbi:hypothetical protein EVAR_92658_1 [Eumeta japonica]|uniref:Uncharacterized protein n=1 Tax=Eumeta variegata TaxID=151549 RepID=A0A4C1SXR9_EUMVA|nr:hypothetical protein EVAR_92658_1 [Eumeta japonica]